MMGQLTLKDQDATERRCPSPFLVQGFQWLAQVFKWLAQGLKWLAQGLKRLAQGLKWLAREVGGDAENDPTITQSVHS